jgi:hypothetical protein
MQTTRTLLTRASRTLSRQPPSSRALSMSTSPASSILANSQLSQARAVRGVAEQAVRGFTSSAARAAASYASSSLNFRLSHLTSLPRTSSNSTHRSTTALVPATSFNRPTTTPFKSPPSLPPPVSHFPTASSFLHPFSSSAVRCSCGT